MSLDNKVVDLADLKVSHDYLLGQDELLSDRINELGSGIDGIQSQITALGNGSPIPVETVAEMTDNTKAYLYTGSEQGHTSGYWYTYDSTQAKFVPRGEYGAGVIIDSTLTVTGNAADAKATGDAIKAGKTFVVHVPGSAAVLSGSITAGDFAKALAAYTAGSGVYAVKDGEVYQLSAASSSTMTFTQMYHGTMNFIKQIQITSADTFTVTNTALSSSATDTSYSNTASGLTATNVQEAIDESAASLSNVNGRLVSLQETSDYNFEKVAGTIYLPVDVTEESTILEITTNTSKFSASSNARALVVPILPGKTITVTKLLSSRFKLATCVDYPAVGGDITNFILSSNTQATLTKLTITAGENDHYLFIYYYLMPEGEQSNTEPAVKASIKAFYGEAETESPILTDANAYTDERMESLNTGDQLKDMMSLMQAVNLTEANSNIFEDESVINSVINSSGKIAAASSTKSTFIPIKGNAIVTVAATTKCNRFIISTTAELPANGVSVLSTATPGGSIRTYTFVTPGEAKYLLITYWNSSSSYTEDEARADISVIYGTVAGTEYADRLHNPNISSMLMLNDQMLNLLSVRQLGSLKKGYVALSADDGRYPLATYVLPTLAAYATQYGKPIPLTMGLADVTPAFDVCDNAEYIATVKNSLDNYECSIGIHGLTMFTGYTREALYNYFVAQNEKLHTMFGHYPSSVLYVSHGINTQVRAIAGSFYGVCGSIPTGAGTDVSEFGNTNRANVYAMKRFSLLNTGLTMQNLYDAVDHALANHEILCPYWHDINFEEDTSGVLSGQEAKDRFEAFIEYCMSKNVDFINFGDIPMLEVNT